MSSIRLPPPTNFAGAHDQLRTGEHIVALIPLHLRPRRRRRMLCTAVSCASSSVCAPPTTRNPDPTATPTPTPTLSDLHRSPQHPPGPALRQALADNGIATMNGSQAAEGQKLPLASGESSNGGSLVAKKRKKDGLKPIITTDGGKPLQYDDGGDDDDDEQGEPGQPGCV
ncbi:hypothetical protein TOPH_03881 [Tolypocladium ophioglossoides CBS 100239]|uniref:Uncharacterized protein n=1 Tax=Tolypocladium ophioglossoides (strain CBS 100239) TaxID=1163406 RepID=A0A0L0NC94_TOLOC|nr:hypothetical protein TOPH_03881 [Tolypocladium ophioglossoides CBS 100239]